MDRSAVPNNGLLPETGTNGFAQERIRFDSAGRPVVAGIIGVLDSTATSSSEGVAVYRFNGTSWSTTGGYQLPNSYINQLNAGYTMVGDVAYVTWFNQYRDSSANSNLLVQTNTPAGWASVGSGPDGTLTAYLMGTATHTASVKRQTGDPRMITIGNDVCVAIIVQTPPPSNFGTTVSEAVLLKLVR